MHSLTAQQRFLHSIGADISVHARLAIELTSPISRSLIKNLETIVSRLGVTRCKLQPVKYHKYPALMFCDDGTVTIDFEWVDEFRLNISFSILIWDVFSVLKLIESSISSSDIQPTYFQDSLKAAEVEVGVVTDASPADLAVTSPKLYRNSGFFLNHVRFQGDAASAISKALERSAFSPGKILTDIDVSASQRDAVGNLAYTVLQDAPLEDLGGVLGSHVAFASASDNPSTSFSLVVLPAIAEVSAITVQASTTSPSVSAFVYHNGTETHLSLNISRARFSESESGRFTEFIKTWVLDGRPLLPPIQAAILKPSKPHVARMIHAALLRDPSAPALITSKGSKSRFELLRAVQRLRAQIPADATSVGILGGNTMEFVVAALACMFSGKTYIPLDLNAGKFRVEEIVEHSGMSHVVFVSEDMSFRGIIPQSRAIEIPVGLWAGGGFEAPELKEGEDIYQLYTSGSTGVPKGVRISDRNLSALFDSYDVMFPRVYEACWGFTSAIGFDASVKQYLGTLLHGGLIAIPDVRLHEGGVNVLNQLLRMGAKVLNLTPSLLDVFLRAGANVNGFDFVFVGGETCSPELVSRFHELAPKARLVNLYGPTECTINATAHEFSRQYSVRVSPLGKALPTASVAILMNDGSLAAYCEDGDLVIAGPLVASDFASEGGEVLFHQPSYNTHDRCRVWFDDLIYFLGRDDSQIKINGVRMDLNELAITLKKICDLEVVHVLPIDGRLHAFISVSGMNQARRNELETFFTSSTIHHAKIRPVFVDQWKWMPSGKLDFNAILAGQVPHSDKGFSNSPAAGSVMALEVLSIVDRLCKERALPAVTIDKSLADHGFDSLLYMELILEIERVIGAVLTPLDVAADNTVITIAKRCEERQSSLPLIRWSPGSDQKKSVLVLVPPVAGKGIIFEKLLPVLCKSNAVALVDYPPPEDDTTPSVMAAAIESMLLMRDLSAFDKIAVIGYSMGASIGFELVKLLEKFGLEKIQFHVIDKSARNRLPFDEQLKRNVAILEATYAGRQLSEGLRADLLANIAAYTRIGYQYSMSGCVRSPIRLTICKDESIPVDVQDWAEFTSSTVAVEEIACTHEQVMHPNHVTQVFSPYI